ncbi:ferric reductase like transmembrane component-domain-containing protein [Aspergillus avenaceus]|uniref:Ferric reductase like transmembrane component-domain-containing protein n=1 Tax=Aspergillus avenaceus TaxID=36643 RepID=A0A5N6U007_ASPAV|nr:ferric reductase like transmembrane component-domain-containing protein [Aspergillus avenaceus]
MDDLRRRIIPRGYGTNSTYVYTYSRGLDGVNVPRDVIITRIILIGVLGLAFGVFCGRIGQISHAYLRHITSLNASRRQQTFWSTEQSSLWPTIKKHLLYSPIGRKRHNREIQLSSALNVGTLPSRFQTILILLYVAGQLAYCTILDYSANEKKALIAELRGRSGTLAVLNMVPLFLLAGRNNPLIPILHISFDTYNTLHRWLGRIVVIESVVHTAAWAVNAANEADVSDMLSRLRDTPFFTWGLVGTVAMIFLCLHSPSPIRHAFYETFLHLHQLAALLAFIGVWMHLDLDDLPQKPWAMAIAVFWIFDRTARFLRLMYLNISFRKGATNMVVEALPGEACRVTFHLPKRVRINPGCHVYAYIPSVSLWMSHPFSVAWVEPSSSVTVTNPGPENLFKSPVSADSTSPSLLEKQGVVDLDDYMRDSQKPTSVSLIMGAQQGMTRKLYNKALVAPSQTLTLSGYIEGPYRSHVSNMGSYGTAVLFSGGAGITHHMLYCRDLILRAYEGRVATQQIYLIWSVRSTDNLAWVQEWMDQILRLPGRRDILTIKLFVSKPKSQREIVSPSATVQMFPGRCRPQVVLDEVIPKRVGATIVSVCGPGAFADEVRAAARDNIGKGAVVDFVEEAFTW